jgi:MFS family permease
MSSVPPFTPLFCLCAVATAYVTYLTSSANSTSKPNSEAFLSFQKLYLSAYLCMVAGDWMQGPYVYALYDSYGFSQSSIAVLFVAGFGSSMIFGTVVGSFADKFGRKKFALLYVVCYVASCMSKHINSFSVLLLGRFLGGVSTSLLFSVFDAWMINEHNSRGFDPALLSDTFTKAIFTNSVVAIVSGLVANAAASYAPLATFSTTPFEPNDGSFMVGGFCAPFDVAICVLLLGGTIITNYWGENYGARSTDSGAEADNFSAIRNGIAAVRADEKILLCGLISSLFEGSMYAFVFMWTPALQGPEASGGHRLLSEGAGALPFGLIFATFMVCCMAGSSVFGMYVKDMKVQDIGTKAFILATGALFIPVVTTNTTVVFIAFLVFEFTVGVYFPVMGTLKSSIVPEKMRSTIYNIYRIPLNIIVLTVLLTSMSIPTTFMCCSIMLAGAAYCQNRLSLLLAADAVAAPASSKEDLEAQDERRAMLETDFEKSED